MLSKLLQLLRKYDAVLKYSLFGVITTLVNYAVYYPLYNYFGISAFISSIIAWCAAVLAAFFTNKPFVFKSKDWSVRVFVPELLRFVGCRFGSGAAESLILFVTVDILNWNGNIWKLIVSVFVVILNYISSKLFVFK